MIELNSMKKNLFIPVKTKHGMIKNFSFYTLFFVLFFSIFIISENCKAQTAADYIFSYSSGTYSAISGTVSTASGDDGIQSGIPIGFTFNYCGNNYTTFGVSTNGNMYLSGSTSYSNNLASTSNKTILAPLWDDLYDDSGSDIQYLLSGTTPNQILTVQWRNIRWYLSGGTQQNFQVKLYETSNIIEFIYGTMPAPSGSPSASIGINDATGGSGHFISITPSASPTYSTATANNSINAATYLTSGLKYRFSPPTCFVPTALTSSAVTATTATLSWTAASPAPSNGYEYEVRTSGAAGSGPTGLVVSGSTVAGDVDDNISGLSPVATYYVYVRSFCGGSDYSAWTSSYSFMTACGAISSLPWTENFDGVTIPSFPSCWYKENGDWATTNNSNSSLDADAHTGSQFLREALTATNEFIWTPGFALTSGISYDFSFYWAGDNYSGWTGDVFYNTNQTSSGATQLGGSFVTIGTTTTKTYDQVIRTFVPPSTGTYYFAIRVNANSIPWYLSFDDFSVSLTPPPAVFINASSGTTYGEYTTLKQAFDAINAGTHTGNISIELGSEDDQTITEIAQAVLNASGSGAASYTNITISPAFSNITVTGSFAGACCYPTGVIQLNKAEDVTIDGRIGMTGSTNNLTIENSSIGSWATAIFMYGASNDIIRYCTIKSSTTCTSSGVGTISMQLNGTSGCSNNTIEYCKITKSGSDMPMVAIASSNTSSSYYSQSNTVRYCTINDFKNAGIWLGNSGMATYNNLWTIDNNIFYLTTTLAYGASSYSNHAIYIGYHSVGSMSSLYNDRGTHVISNNIIGGNGGAKGNWSITGTSSSNFVAPIYIAASNPSAGINTAAYTEAYGNTIKDFEVQAQYFAGICSDKSKIKAGNSSSGNFIYNITLNHASASTGGTAAGVYVNASSNYSNEVVMNTVHDITADVGSGASYWYNFYGIYDYAGSSVSTNINSGNRVYNISTTKAPSTYGLYVDGNAVLNHVSRIKINHATGLLFGIYWIITGSGNAANYRVENNEIILGLDMDGNATATAAANDIVGIKLCAQNVIAYYNSVLIQGSSSSNKSACLRMNFTGNGSTIVNNLLYNERTGGAGKHLCISSAISIAGDLVSSNNAYIVGTGGTNYLGDWATNTSSDIALTYTGGSLKTSLADWTASATNETNSKSEVSTNKPTATLFPSLGSSQNLDPAEDKWLCGGIVVTPVTDFDGAPMERHDPAPTTIGAYEIDCPALLPVELLWFEGDNFEKNKIKLSWATASELNNDFFTIEKSADGVYFEPIIIVKGAGNSNSILTYAVFDTLPLQGVNYYRLRQTDFDGSTSYTQTISVDYFNNDNEIGIYPNPFDKYIIVKSPINIETDSAVKLFDIAGKEIPLKSSMMNGNIMYLTFDDQLPDGIYFVRFSSHEGTKYFKVIKAD